LFGQQTFLAEHTDAHLIQLGEIRSRTDLGKGLLDEQ
jgi:hypothetical protein